MLVAQVPGDAQSGPISVAAGGSSVSSDGGFTVLASIAAPAISGLSAAIASPGQAVTIAGANFAAPDLTANRIVFNTVQAAATAGTSGSLVTTVPIGATSGTVTVATANGRVRGPDLFVPPAPYAPADIDSTGRTAVDVGASTIGVGTAGRVSLLVVDGGRGQRLTADFTWSAGSNASFTLLDPFGRVVWTNGVGAVDAFILPLAGSYTVLVTPPGGGTGMATVQFHSVPPDATGSLAVDGGPVSVSNTARGQNIAYAFIGTQGQRMAMQYSYRASPVGYTCVPFAVLGRTGVRCARMAAPAILVRRSSSIP